MTTMRVFISYSRKDEDFAWEIAHTLMEHNVEIWMDQMHISPGQHWDRTIHQALKDTTHMIVIHSQASFNSEHVWDEWSYFLDRHKPVIPLIVDASELPFRLERVQSIRFDADSSSEGFRKLLSILRPYPIPPSPNFTQYTPQKASQNGNGRYTNNNGKHNGKLSDSVDSLMDAFFIVSDTPSKLARQHFRASFISTSSQQAKAHLVQQ
jgi:hypothetical protein